MAICHIIWLLILLRIMQICMRGKDLQKQLARTSLKETGHFQYRDVYVGLQRPNYFKILTFHDNTQTTLKFS